jgi:succinate-acetate transporter protein
LLEFILGNTFPFVVFMGYGAHFLVFATTFIPWFNAVSAYSESGNPYETGSQMQTPAFQASFGMLEKLSCPRCTIRR